jgi:FixJ family two-component response regulator
MVENKTPAHPRIHEATIYIVDDNAELMNALRLNLELEGYKVQNFTSAENFLNNYSTDTLSCLLLDVRMPGMTGDQLQRELLEREIKIPILFMSGYSDVPVVVDALKNGAVDFLTKPVDQQTLQNSISVALKEDIKRRQKEEQNAEVLENYQQLTKRETQILPLIVKGNLNKLIADQLHISVNTVENHRASIMKKMHVKTIADLVCTYLLNGLVDVEPD